MIVNNIEVVTQELQNYFLFDVKISEEYENLKVPTAFIESQDRWVDNPYHPDYVEALQLVQIERQEKAFLKLLKFGVISFNKTTEIISNWNKTYKNLKRNSLMKKEMDSMSEDILILKYIVFINNTDKTRLVEECLLCEDNIIRYMKLYNVTRNMDDIFTYPLKHSINTNVEWQQIQLYGRQLVHPLDEFNACVDVKLDWNLWCLNSYNKMFKEHTIALWRLNKIINSHQEDAIAIENERKNK